MKERTLNMSPGCPIITSMQRTIKGISICVFFDTAFTTLKHGVLGKRQCIPIPKCEESGIQSKFTDEAFNYTGFQYADDLIIINFMLINCDINCVWLNTGIVFPTNSVY